LNFLDIFLLWGWIKSETYKIKVDTRDELLSRAVNADARTKEREDQMRRKPAILQLELQSAL
jgi:hypothetical protein